MVDVGTKAAPPAQDTSVRIGSDCSALSHIRGASRMGIFAVPPPGPPLTTTSYVSFA